MEYVGLVQSGHHHDLI